MNETTEQFLELSNLEDVLFGKVQKGQAPPNHHLRARDRSAAGEHGCRKAAAQHRLSRGKLSAGTPSAGLLTGLASFTNPWSEPVV